MESEIRDELMSILKDSVDYSDVFLTLSGYIAYLEESLRECVGVLESLEGELDEDINCIVNAKIVLELLNE